MTLRFGRGDRKWPLLYLLMRRTRGVAAEENEANVRYALDTFPSLTLVAAEPRVGGAGFGSRTNHGTWNPSPP